MKKKIITILLTIPGILIMLFVIAGCIPQRASSTPAGYKQVQSLYVPMKDGTKIAVKVILPPHIQKKNQVPAVMESTRYSTGYKMTFFANALFNLGVVKDDMPIIVKKLLEKNYAYVLVQARGSGISYGTRKIDYSAQEIRDYGQILDWITKQPWSNGTVGTYGISYMSNTAEMTAALKHPALKAAALLYGDFHPLSSCTVPGGLFSSNFLKRFRDGNYETDHNSLHNGFVSGLTPVDADPDGKMLQEAVEQHQENYDVYQSIKKLEYYDDVVSDGYKGNDLAPYRYKTQIEETGIPLYVCIGWQDAATVNGALQRYLTYSNVQKLVIGPWNHGGDSYKDPFLSSKKTREELLSEQADDVISFFDQHLKNEKKGVSQSEIKYYTFGEGKWKSTDKWPIAGIHMEKLYFDVNGSLSTQKPTVLSGADTYKVNYSASTGNTNRWQTNYGAGPVIYPDRQDEDKKLLHYTSNALEENMEITGVPVVTLKLSSTATDGAFLVYLEDVSPDGKVTYLTEGEIRGIHRKISKDNLGYNEVGPKHSYSRKDGSFMVPDKTTEIKIGMQATSVLIKKGHKIRIAIAGSDAGTFDPIAQKDHPVLKIQRNSIDSSYVQLPQKAK
jgi:putative hydrolase, CocE/NonD family